ncbi:hypothetical protein K6U06_06060 [Acidiferrimicrobium sp. IK]|uniref:hypothetical protein n=1 Tax=Acidiferrimicrobium sp. IK TaxID=2871700 RepID=UPI0021CB29F4|nr:hypothetical protein [Acidiferrimicrobium sp. IK]MCU4183918.1 hypothetical protein [Acidiferrimicrobium sp. IK]
MSTGERWVLLGLARGRAGWFRDVGQWATSAAIAAEFIKCVSVEEVRARLASGRPHSALLVDVAVSGFDRDLIGAADAARTPVIAVGDGRASRWSPELGVAATLPPDFGRDQLLELLAAHGRPVSRADTLPPILSEEPLPQWRGRLVAVCGCGGTGASTIAIAIAQGAAGDVRYGRRVVLADLALRADQAVLHEAPDLGPGIQELVDAHRRRRPAPEEVRAMTFDVPSRNYQLLLGLRRPSAWSVLRPRATDAAIDGLRQAFQLTVADVTGDLEGEDDGGSVDVEERNHLARSTTTAADVVFAVGAPGLKGVHSLGRLVTELTASGVDPRRVVPVINRAPRHPRSRAELSGALAVAAGTAGPVNGAVYVPERKVDEAVRDGLALPDGVVAPVVGAMHAVIDRHADAAARLAAPARVTPGSLGHWADSEDLDAS